jgi:HK97 gp10 family phage protein
MIEVYFHKSPDVIAKIKAYPEQCTKIINQTIFKTAQELRSEMKNNLRVNRTNNTAILRNSIVIKPNRQNLTSRVGSEVEYAPYVEYGTRPHFPPIEAIKRWVHLKLKVKLDKIERKVTGNKWAKKLKKIARLDAKEEGVAWAIAKNIAKNGTRAQPYVRPAYRKILPGFKQKLVDAIRALKIG